MVLVHSALDHRETRDLIRETWGTNFAPEKPARMLFALGRNKLYSLSVLTLFISLPCYMGSITGITDAEHTMRSIKAEANVLGDIVQGNFIDSYRQGNRF